MSDMPATIRLRGNKGQRDERIANGALYPGHLLKVDSNDKVLKHSTYGGRGELIFALEDTLQGNGVADAYADGALVFTYSPLPGDIINARVAAAAPAITKGDALVSAGDGTLTKQIVIANTTLYANSASSTASTPVTTAETDYSLTYSLPANSVQVGDILHIVAQGTLTTTTSTDKATIKLYLGATAICTIPGTFDPTDGDIFVIDVNVVVRAITSAGKFIVEGICGTGTAGAITTTEHMSPWNLAEVTGFDFTAAKTIKVSQTWSGNAGSTAVSTLNVLTVELRRSGSNTVLAFANATVDNSAGGSEVFCPVRVL